jgi:glycosyltransferase involved in cell wall biosynthesis
MQETKSMTAPLMPRNRAPVVSLVVPVFNEQEVLGIFLERTSPVLEAAGLDYEYVFVNDGSSDQTLPLLITLSGENNRIRVVDLSRNFGKEAALTAGINHARGDVMVPMDVDLQDPPELIPAFVEKWREGYDVVYGVRTSRDEDSWGKRMTAGGFYRVFNRLSPTHIPDNAGDFRLLDHRVVEVLKQLPERNRFMKGLFSWVGFRSAAVPYERPARAAGQTKWNLRKLWNFALDGLVSFTTVPLRVWSYVGVVVSLISFAYALFIITRVLIFGVDSPGYASLLVVVLFLGGIQLISLGIIGEYLGRLFLESKARPIYIVDRVYECGVEEKTAGYRKAGGIEADP